MTELTREPTFSDNFFEDTEMSRYKDVKIILVDEPMRPGYHLHKVILAAFSSFFRKLFYHEPKEVYEIGAVTKKGFEAVLKLMYGQLHSPIQSWWTDDAIDGDRWWTDTELVDAIDGDIMIIEETGLYLGCRLIRSGYGINYIGIKSI